VLVDAAAHDASQKRLAQVENKLGAMEREKAEAHKKATLDAAQKQGKFRASERSHYEGMWAIDAAGTEKLVDALAANTVPVDEIGHGGGAQVQGVRVLVPRPMKRQPASSLPPSMTSAFRPVNLTPGAAARAVSDTRWPYCWGAPAYPARTGTG
jgi:hypothetical protein